MPPMWGRRCRRVGRAALPADSTLNCWRRGRESNPPMEVLQTSALPLGYPAACAVPRIVMRSGPLSMRSVGIDSLLINAPNPPNGGPVRFFPLGSKPEPFPAAACRAAAIRFFPSAPARAGNALKIWPKICAYGRIQPFCALLTVQSTSDCQRLALCSVPLLTSQL